LCRPARGRLHPRRAAKVASLNGLLAGEPADLALLPQCRHATDWVNQPAAPTKSTPRVVFSSAMAQYVEAAAAAPADPGRFRRCRLSQVDPVRARHRWPLSSTRSYFVTENEAALFCQQAPECRVRVEAMCNGVDADYFSPEPSRSSPYQGDELPVVFTGAMDYLPNVDAVTWFTQEVLPDILKRWPQARFHIVGRSPTAEVLALAADRVAVSGTVPDVRPYLQHAAAVVAPLRIARGIQNKILEAMAMARPVIASTECAAAVDAEKCMELLTASSPAEYIAELGRVLDSAEAAVSIGQAARQRVVEHYSWDAHLEAIDRYLPSPEAFAQ
jgi:glycosyltransferase involved in cell wall biosynthesis